MNEPRIVICDDALVVPPLAEGNPHDNGVRTSAGPVPEAVTYRGEHPVHGPPPEVEAAAHLPGTWFWGGPLYWHFGHFLTESATRLWAYSRMQGQIDGVIFTPKRAHAGDTTLAWHDRYFEMIDPAMRVHVADIPVSVERLVVAEQGFGVGQHAIGSDAYRNFLTHNFAADIAPDGPERLYLSRSAFGPQRGGLLGETALEGHLAAEGYEIFHPQDHPLPVQIARMKAARRMIGPDGSAFHLAGLVARPDLLAATIMRRNTGVAQHIIRQFHGLRGVRLHAVNAIRQDWTPGGVPPDRLSFAELDFAELSGALRALGLIGRDGWPDPDPAPIQRRLTRLGRRRGVAMKPITPAPRVQFVFAGAKPDAGSGP